MAVQQGRSKRRGDAYSVRYVEPLSEARTLLADFFSILLEGRPTLADYVAIGPVVLGDTSSPATGGI